jgi:hypothetical protein
MYNTKSKKGPRSDARTVWSSKSYPTHVSTVQYVVFRSIQNAMYNFMKEKVLLGQQEIPGVALRYVPKLNAL